MGRPERCSSEVLLRPLLNSETHCLMVEYDGEDVPNVESISSLISFGVRPFKKKYLMTARFFTFSIFTKNAEASCSACSQTYTNMRIGLKFYIQAIGGWYYRMPSLRRPSGAISWSGRTLIDPPSYIYKRYIILVNNVLHALTQNILFPLFRKVFLLSFVLLYRI